jgi:hypothetical protein
MMKPTDKIQEARDSTLDKIKNVALNASAEDTAMFNEIVALAKAGACSSKVFTLPPAVQALLFVKCNGHNRAWRGTGPKSATEYARRMSSGLWKWNGESISFYIDARLSDGQHRLSGGAISGFTLVTPIVFGVTLDASDTIDDGLARHGSDHVAMRGVKDGKRKQSIIATAGAYLAKAGIPFDALKSEAEIAAAIEAHNQALSKALDFAGLSERNCANPLLSTTEAARIAFVMLFGSWPDGKIAHVLSRLQSGTSPDAEGGDKSPLFIAAEIIAAKTKGKSIAAVKQVGLVISAAMMVERGEKSSSRTMRAEIDKQIPNPAFPLADVQEAA